MREYTHLCRRERSQIGIWLKRGISHSEIARRLGRATSTISRELKRGFTSFGYCCHRSHAEAKARRFRANKERRKVTEERESIICDGLLDRFSPEQIAAVFSRKTGVSISTVTVYRWIHQYHRGGRHGFVKLLREKGKRRRKYSRKNALQWNRPMISQRPESVAARRFYGDWEADLMEGPSHSTRSLLVLTDRKSRYTVIRPVENRKADTVARAIIQSLQPYRVRTITYDNGSEFAKFAEVCEATRSKAYFCNPYHAWEKPLVENTIGLLREYFPKKTKTALPENPQLYRDIQNQLNRRPRKILHFQSPDQLLAKIKNKSNTNP